jgi:arylsulfatase A-like enzyme
MTPTTQRFAEAAGILCAILISGSLARPALAETVQKPNVIIIFTDDQGYQDVGCFGSPKIKTPELDRMAKEGRRFTSFYVAASICSPSRAALMTGRYPVRLGLRGVFFPTSKNGLKTSEITLANVLKKQGYATACIGKWHLGHLPQYMPTSRGFDSYFGIPYSNDMWLDPKNTPPSADIVLREGKTLEDYKASKRDKHKVPLVRGTECVEWPADQSTLTKRYTEEALKFIRAKKDAPFFLYLAMTMPHVPLFASAEFKGKSARGLYGDTIEEIDWSVGLVLKTLRELGLDRRTLVVYTSDNGPWLKYGKNGGCALPLRDGKFSTYEGGQREPCIMWWPGQIPAGTVCDEIASAMDMMPTVSRLAGTSAPSDRKIDGHDILALMRGEPGATTPYKAFFYGTQAVRVGDFKYRQGGGRKRGKGEVKGDELYNLRAEISEKTNLVEKDRQKADELKSLLEKFRQEIGGGRKRKQ